MYPAWPGQEGALESSVAERTHEGLPLDCCAGGSHPVIGWASALGG